MSEQAGMRARALYESRCHAALTKFDFNLGEMTRKTAYNTLIDDLLKAWDASHLDAQQVRRQQRVTAKALDAALANIRATTPEQRAGQLRASRTDIGRQPTYGTRKATG